MSQPTNETPSDTPITDAAWESAKHQEFSTIARVMFAKSQAIERAANALRDALEGYRSVCGNTAYQVSRDSARELYDQSGAALDTFTRLLASLKGAKG